MFKKWMEQETESPQVSPERTEYSRPATEDVATNLSADTHFKGSLTFDRTVKIEGEFEGEISTSGTLLVGKEAKIKAEIKARSAYVEGSITGNVTVEDKLHLRNTAKLFGDIKAGRLIVEEGAIVAGHCQVQANNEGKASGRPAEAEEMSSYKIPIELNSSMS